MTVSRRDALLLLGSAAASTHPLLAAAAKPKRKPATPKSFVLTAADEAFLDDLERRACRYFLEQVGAGSGQVLDRAAAANPDGTRDARIEASIAATGFGLSALAIADKRGYADPAAIRAQVLRCLRFHATALKHEHGFFYHFNHVDTGAPLTWSEVSSIDTALLLCGVLTARAHFSDTPEIVQLATTIYERVDWPWMLNGGTEFSMGWNAPKGQARGVATGGFLQARWNHYCELMMIPLLAMGSPTHPCGAEVWSAWSRPRMEYAGYRYISGTDPLFVHQYSHAWFDFRNRRDAYADYFANSVDATLAHRAFCLAQGEPYSARYWGISASDSPTGYQAWGGPPAIGRLDGTVVPCAAGGSLAFTPRASLDVLQALKADHGDRVWGRYGFADAFNPGKPWYGPDVLGIDLGITLLMAENLRSGFVWSTFARNAEVAVAMGKAGFRAV